MTARERKKWLFEQIRRLRHAEREAPRSRDVVAVRVALEKELGGSLAPSLAAEILGLSHTALLKWTRSGDIPVVVNSRGRKEIPVGALVDLHDSVRREREVGRRRRHTLEPSLASARQRASELDPRKLVQREPDGDRHDLAQLRSLAYHRALANRLRRPMVEDAKHVLWEWRQTGAIHDRYADEWEQVLNRPLSEIRRILSADDPYAADLRQNSPFAGSLSERERQRIFDELR